MNSSVTGDYMLAMDGACKHDTLAASVEMRREEEDEQQLDKVRIPYLDLNRPPSNGDSNCKKKLI